MGDESNMTDNDVRCDECGTIVPIPSRHGDTCNATVAGGGYCNGTLLLAERFRPASVAVVADDPGRVLRAKLARFPAGVIARTEEEGLPSGEIDELVSACRLFGRLHWRAIAAANPDIRGQMAEIEELAAGKHGNVRQWTDLGVGLADDPYGVGA